ncbi:hypothetical protein [Marivita sp.]|uniref:hypothetical protein n=1 Tax=Marivita sp. TaxID=2003365 RepID=UPI0025B8530F|nr:hypothetical protein [Marivita sp.]
MKNLFEKSPFAALVLAATFFSGTTFAGSGNSVLVEQIATSAGGSNTLIIDQSAASNSTVGGISLDRELELDLSELGPVDLNTFATTLGQASSVALSENLLTISGGGAKATQRGAGNTASIALKGDGGKAGLEQFGNDNRATILVNEAALGVIVQEGNQNTGVLSVSDLGASGELIQLGNGNMTELEVSGVQDANVSYTVQGNGVTTSIPASVVSNVNGQITIVQSQFTTFQSP